MIVIDRIAGLCHSVFPSIIATLLITITQYLPPELQKAGLKSACVPGQRSPQQNLRARSRIVAQIVEQDRLQIAFRHAGKERDDDLAAILLSARFL